MNTMTVLDTKLETKPIVPPAYIDPDDEPDTPLECFIGWRFPRGAAVVNVLMDRLQLLFDFGQYPDDEEKRELRRAGFHFAKSQNYAWQRELDWKGIQSAGKIRWLWPCSGKSPSEIQPRIFRQDI